MPIKEIFWLTLYNSKSPITEPILSIKEAKSTILASGPASIPALLSSPEKRKLTASISSLLLLKIVPISKSATLFLP